MTYFRISYSYLRFIFFFVICPLQAFSQPANNTIIKGTVIDASTRGPLAFVSVILENTTVGTNTGIDGKYSIVTSTTAYKIKFSFLGYETESRVISPGKTQVFNVELKPADVQLGEVVVKPAKRTYSNKNNPAVDLIERVIANKSLNRKESLDYYNYEKYEKIVFALSNISEKFKEAGAFKKIRFIFDNIDTSRLDGKENLPLFIKEKQSDYYRRKTPAAEKEIIRAEKTINFSEYIDNDGVSANLDYLYQNIDIYDNDIFFLTNKFLSPVAREAPVFYRYFIMDTSFVNDTKCYRMFFEPRNPADFLFHGFLFITADSCFAIRKIDMSFNKGINIDWIKDVRIVQNFDRIRDKAWVLTRDEVMIDFGLRENLPGMVGLREVSYNKYAINEPLADTIFKGLAVVTKNDASEKDQGYWDSVRIPPLTNTEKGIYTLVDSVRKVPSFGRSMNILMLMTTEFYTRRKIEIGPVGNFYSYNPIEGSRVRFGGRTTPDFNKTIYFESYIAYGSKDERFKYNIAATYSLKHTSVYRFPLKYIKVNYQNDTKIPGQELQYSTGDNIFFSLKRGADDKLFYNKTFRIEYLNEFENHFSYSIGYDLTRQSTGGNIHFTSNDNFLLSGEIPCLSITEVNLKLRYAPGETFYQGKIYRDPVPSKYPVLKFKYIIGSKSLNNDYNYQKIELGISKRFYLSIVGYTDVSAEAGKIFGRVPYPLLFIHNANQTYSYQRYSYNMMNFLEFVSDEYVSLNIDHSFNGFFFNKVPLLKKLKLREIATLKVLYGGVTRNNNPDFQSDLFKFPKDIDGTPLTYTLEKKPYIEASVGVSNILKIFRIDIIKRITYLNYPNVSDWGVRLQFRFDI